MKLACLVGVTFLWIVNAEIAEDTASNSLNLFGLKFLAETSRLIPENINLAISPYTVWTAMSIVNEGSRANTAAELDKTLYIPPSNSSDRQQFRKLQQHLVQKVAQKYEGVTLEVLNSMFTRAEAKLKPEYANLVQELYGVKLEPLDFKDPVRAADRINKVISDATHGRIPQIVNADTVKSTYMFITSALFFKGLWDKKFEKAYTKPQPFYDEQRRQIGNVQMMHTSGAFPFGSILNGKAVAVELPYIGGNVSMIVVLPVGNEPLSSILRAITETPISQITDYLRKTKERFSNSEIKVFLPKFKIATDLALNEVLRNMGVNDLFEDARADLSGISETASLFVSKVVHKTEIEVDEEGTTGSSATTVDVIEKSKAPVFIADKPFAFFVIEKETQTILLAGKFSKPDA